MSRSSGTRAAARRGCCRRCARRARRSLDLEALAAHRGSLLGALPGEAQPSQKGFDSALVGVLRGFDASRPVFVEAESRRIGAITLPESLLTTFHQGACVEVEASHDDRIAFLLQDYGHLFDEPAFFKQQLSKLIGLHSRERVTRWHRLIDEDARAELFAELIDLHYDPAYARSSGAHFSELAQRDARAVSPERRRQRRAGEGASRATE